MGRGDRAGGRRGLPGRAPGGRRAPGPQYPLRAPGPEAPGGPDRDRHPFTVRALAVLALASSAAPVVAAPNQVFIDRGIIEYDDKDYQGLADEERPGAQRAEADELGGNPPGQRLLRLLPPGGIDHDRRGPVLLDLQRRHRLLQSEGLPADLRGGLPADGRRPPIDDRRSLRVRADRAAQLVALVPQHRPAVCVVRLDSRDGHYRLLPLREQRLQAGADPGPGGGEAGFRRPSSGLLPGVLSLTRSARRQDARQDQGSCVGSPRGARRRAGRRPSSTRSARPTCGRRSARSCAPDVSARHRRDGTARAGSSLLPALPVSLPAPGPRATTHP